MADVFNDVEDHGFAKSHCICFLVGDWKLMLSEELFGCVVDVDVLGAELVQELCDKNCFCNVSGKDGRNPFSIGEKSDCIVIPSFVA